MSKIYRERTGGYTVRFYAYNGINYSLCDDATKEDARKAIRSHLKRAKRNGCPVSKLANGRWEVQTPDDAVGVSDNEGTVAVYPTVRRYRRILGRKSYQD